MAAARSRSGLRAILGGALSLLLVLLIAPAAANAGRVRPVGLADMAGRAQRAFVGRCVAVDVAAHPSLGLPVTAYTFAVAEPIKGVERGRVTFRIPGTPRAPLLEGLPAFEVGEEALVFLYPESEAGFASVLGLDQGRFRVLRDGAGRAASAINARGNAGLLDDVPEAVLRESGLERRRRGPLALDRLVAAARALARGTGSR